MAKSMESEDTYWTLMELRLELMRGSEGASLRFREQLRQILMDMRLYQEPTESILRMVSRLLERTDAANRRLFLDHVERVAFDTRLAPEHSDAFIAFLKAVQKLSDG
jgi:hypothetical protein